MTRIVGGTVGGRRIRTPPGDRTRPTSDRVREALFSALDSLFGAQGSGGGWDGVRVLDLFAGSGALGLESASRGAASVVMVEKVARTAAIAADNARTLGLPGTTVRAATVETFLRAEAERRAFGPVDLVLADPPYPLSEDGLATVLGLLADGWLAPDAVVVVERSRRAPQPRWPDGLVHDRSRAYGETVLHTALWYGPATDR